MQTRAVFPETSQPGMLPCKLSDELMGLPNPPLFLSETESLMPLDSCASSFYLPSARIIGMQRHLQILTLIVKLKKKKTIFGEMLCD